MVEGVEEIRTEFEFAATRLAKQEALEQREIPVLIAGTAQEVERRVAPIPGYCWRERRGIEPTGNRFGIADAATHVGPVVGIGDDVAGYAR